MRFDLILATWKSRECVVAWPSFSERSTPDRRCSGRRARHAKASRYGPKPTDVRRSDTRISSTVFGLPRHIIRHFIIARATVCLQSRKYQSYFFFSKGNSETTGILDASRNKTVNKKYANRQFIAGASRLNNNKQFMVMSRVSWAPL